MNFTEGSGVALCILTPVKLILASRRDKSQGWCREESSGSAVHFINLSISFATNRTLACRIVQY